MAECFVPHHGLRFQNYAESLDVLICFQCYLIYLFRGSERECLALSNSGYGRLAVAFSELGEQWAPPPQEPKGPPLVL